MGKRGMAISGEKNKKRKWRSVRIDISMAPALLSSNHRAAPGSGMAA